MNSILENTDDKQKSDDVSDMLHSKYTVYERGYAHTGAFPELLRIYHLLGDPGLRIR